MNFEPLLTALAPIPSHAFAAMACMIAGAIQLWMTKGTQTHRILGWIWVILMAYVALTGLFIWEIRLFWLFSPIHLLSLWLLYSLYRAVRDARAGNIRAHKRNMITTYILALLVTGLFTFLPGRTMYAVLFG